MEARLAPGPQSVVLDGDDNVLPIIKTYVSGRTLIVEPDEDFESVVPLAIVLHAPVLHGGAVHAGGALWVSDVEADDFALTVTAGGDISATGRTRRLVTRLEAGGTINARGVAVESATIRASAGGTTLVRASRRVEGSVESGSEVHVLGQPVERFVSTDSGGSVSFD